MNLEQQKKQARELLRAIRGGNHDAISRLLRHHSRWTRSIKDDLYHSTAEGGAQYFGQVEVRDYLRSLADC